MLFSLLRVKHNPLFTSKDLALSGLNISTWNYTNANLTENSGLLSFQFFEQIRNFCQLLPIHSFTLFYCGI